MIRDKQRVFDATVAFLIGQNRRSSTPTPHENHYPGAGCLYRGPEQTRCAGGAWIPDEKYDSELEGRSLSAFLPHGSSPGVIPMGEEELILLHDLQKAHDRVTFFSHAGYRHLKEIAAKHLLNTDVLDALWRSGKHPPAGEIVG